MILPRKVIVPRLPCGLRDDRALFARKAEIADRDRPSAIGLAAPVGVGKGVKLLDIAERKPRLALDPGTQGQLQRAMPDLERPRWKRAPGIDRHRQRYTVRNRDKHSDQFDSDWLRRNFP